MTSFPTGFGTQVTSLTALDRDDAIMGNVDGAKANLSLSAVRGYVDAAHYADLPAVLLDAGASLTNWAASNTNDGAGISLDTVQVPNAIKCPMGYNFGSPTKFWLNLPSDQAVGLYTHVQFELMYDTGDWRFNTNPTLQLVTASAVNGGGTRSVLAFPDIQRQAPQDDVFFTVRVPLTGLTNVRSIGVEVPTSVGSNRSNVWMRNVYLAAATGLDQAIRVAGTNGRVVIPPSYTTAVTQKPWITDRPSGLKVDDLRTGHRTGMGGKVWARDYFIDSTGTQDVSSDLSYLYNRILQPGTTFQLDPGGYYKCETLVHGATSSRAFLWIKGARGIVTEGSGATIFQDAVTTKTVLSTVIGVNTSIIVAINTCEDMTFRDVNVRGNQYVQCRTSSLVSQAGSPTVVGTGVELDAQNDTIRPINLSAGEPLGLGRDRLGKCKIQIDAHDTAQVANDLKINIIHPISGAVLFTTTFTLTASQATYTYEFDPNDFDLEVPYFIDILKSTATTNTITIDFVRLYRVQGYWDDGTAGSPFNAAWAVSLSNTIKLERCSGESVSGDGFQVSGLTRHLKLNKFYSRCANRQGISVNWVDDCELIDCTAVFAARQGLDVEPEAIGWIVHNLYIRNFRAIWNHFNGILAGNWGWIKNLNVDGAYMADSGTLAWTIGALKGTLNNLVSVTDWRTRAATYHDGTIFGQDMVLGAHSSPYGVGTSTTGALSEASVALTVNPPTLMSDNRVQAVTYAASITPDLRLGSVLKLGSLTGNLTINDPINFATASYYIAGQRLRFILPQDATGSRVVTFGTAYRKKTTLAQVASQTDVIEFMYDGTNFIEVAATTGIA